MGIKHGESFTFLRSFMLRQISAYPWGRRHQCTALHPSRIIRIAWKAPATRSLTYLSHRHRSPQSQPSAFKISEHALLEKRYARAP